MAAKKKTKMESSIYINNNSNSVELSYLVFLYLTWDCSTWHLQAQLLDEENSHLTAAKQNAFITEM